VFGLVGDTTVIDEKQVRANPYVENVQRVSEPYKKANRLFHEADSIIDVGGIKVGGSEKIAVIGGPCSIESEEQAVRIAREVKDAGGCMLRGGAYKPRTSPYAFQGLGTEGILAMAAARKATGMPIVSELMSEDKIDEFEEYVDLVQIVRAICRTSSFEGRGQNEKPVLLKRGLANTIEEWIMARSTSWPAAMKTSFSASAASARLKNTPQHAGPFGGAHPQAEIPSACHHRPQPRHGRLAPCGKHEPCGHCGRGGRPDH
jgi:3-deoxy-7-phosphoheptulonate synthase